MSANRFKLNDLIVCFIILIFMAGLVVAQDERSIETANRIKCASNLRQIGQAMLLYANDNRGSYPRTIWNQGDDPKPVWGTPYQADSTLGACNSNNGPDPFIADGKPESKYRPDPNDVTAAMFLLLRSGDITSEVFVCPSSDAERWDYGGGTNTPQNWSNWNGNKELARHLSYSFNNPYFSNKALAAGLNWNSSISAEYAVAGDLNPGTDDLLKLTVHSSAADLRRGNSLNHSQDGQNVLFGDGHVEFDQNCLVGSKRDNIYTSESPDQPENDKSASAGIIGAPVGLDDTVLLPTAQSIGQMVIQPATPDQAAAIEKKLSGKYTRTVGGLSVQLAVTDKTISEITVPGLEPVPYNYELKGTLDDQVRLTVTDPESKAFDARIDFTNNGIKISKCGPFSGNWTKD